MSTDTFFSLILRMNGVGNSSAVDEAQTVFTSKLHAVLREGGLSLERDLHDWLGEARFAELLDGGKPTLEEATVLTQLISKHELVLEREHASGFEPIRPDATDAEHATAQPRLHRPPISQIAAGVAGLAAVGALSFAIYAQTSAQTWREAAVTADTFSAQLVTTLAEELPYDTSTPVFETLASEALAYYEAHGEFASAEALKNWSNVFIIVGRQRWNGGDTRGARQAFQTAVAATEQYVAARNGAIDAVFDQSQAVFWLADFNYRNGDFDAAEAGYTQYAALTAQLHDADPDRPLYQAEYAYGYLNTAIMDLERGRIGEALDGFTTATARLTDVARTSDAVSPMEVANALAWRADALFLNGEFREAVTSREAERDLYSQLDAPSNTVVDRRLHSMASQSRALLTLAEVDAADILVSDALVEASSAMRMRPDDIAALRRYLALMAQRAEINLAQGRSISAKMIIDRARAEYADGMAGTQRITHPREAAQLALLSVPVALDLGSPQSARSEALAAVDLLSSLEDKDIYSAVMLAEAYERLGDAELDLGRPDLALRAWQQAAAVCEQGPRNIHLDAIHARLLHRQGDVESAHSLRAYVAQSGYAHPLDAAFWQSANTPGVAQTRGDELRNDG